jgi:hypothetical protein
MRKTKKNLAALLISAMLTVNLSLARPADKPENNFQIKRFEFSPSVALCSSEGLGYKTGFGAGFSSRLKTTHFFISANYENTNEAKYRIDPSIKSTGRTWSYGGSLGINIYKDFVAGCSVGKTGYETRFINSEGKEVERWAKKSPCWEASPFIGYDSDEWGVLLSYAFQNKSVNKSSSWSVDVRADLSRLFALCFGGGIVRFDQASEDPQTHITTIKRKTGSYYDVSLKMDLVNLVKMLF